MNDEKKIKSVKVLNPAWGGVSRTIKANYYKMGERNFLFTKKDGFSASGLIIEYE